MFGGAPGTGRIGLLHRSFDIRGDGGGNHGEGDNAFHRASRVTVIDNFGAANPGREARN